MGFPRAAASLLSSMLVAAVLGQLEATAPGTSDQASPSCKPDSSTSDQASPSCKTDSSGSCVGGKSEGSVLLQLGSGTVDPHEVEEAQGLFPSTCRSSREKLEYAVDVALKCGAALGDAWNCLQTLASPLDFMDCAKAVHTNTACKEAMSRGCGVLEPKCSRCKTNKPMSNQKHGCLLEIYKGDSSGAACKLLDYSSGRYPQEWFGSWKGNYRFYGSCSEAEDKGGAKFTQHVLCPTPWTDWH